MAESKKEVTAVREQLYAAVRLALRFSPPMTPMEIWAEVDLAIKAELKKQEERKLENLTKAREIRRANQKQTPVL